MPDTEQYECKTIVMKSQLDENFAKEMIEEKKTRVFRSLLRKPKREDVHIHSLKLFYESILIVSGKYIADFFRKATHTISVDNNVNEVVLGDGVFSIRSKSGFAKALHKRGKNKVDLRVEEHVFLEEEGQMIFDHHGREIKQPFKINSKTIENYPKRTLKKNEPNVKKPEIKYEAALDKLKLKLKRPMDPEVRDLTDEFIVKEVSEVYVPIYEARLIGPQKKVGIMRIDAVRKKIL